MAVDFTENELMEMQKKAIVQARDMHRRAFLISPEPQDERRKAQTVTKEPDAENRRTESPGFQADIEQGRPQQNVRNQSVQTPVADNSAAAKDTGSYAAPQPQTGGMQNHISPAGSRAGSRRNEQPRASIQPQIRQKPNQNLHPATGLNSRQNEPEHPQVQTQAKNSPAGEEPIPPPMRQSRPGLNFGGLFNTGFRNYPPPKEIFKHPDIETRQDAFCSDDCPIKKTLGSGLFGSMGMDNDMMLILALILLLGSEGADQMLIFALLYILL